MGDFAMEYQMVIRAKLSFLHRHFQKKISFQSLFLYTFFYQT